MALQPTTTPWDELVGDRTRADLYYPAWARFMEQQADASPWFDDLSPLERTKLYAIMCDVVEWCFEKAKAYESA
jgi:hypothetical protein